MKSATSVMKRRAAGALSNSPVAVFCPRSTRFLAGAQRHIRSRWIRSCKSKNVIHCQGPTTCPGTRATRSDEEHRRSVVPAAPANPRKDESATDTWRGRRQLPYRTERRPPSTPRQRPRWWPKRPGGQVNDVVPYRRHETPFTDEEKNAYQEVRHPGSNRSQCDARP